VLRNQCESWEESLASKYKEVYSPTRLDMVSKLLQDRNMDWKDLQKTWSSGEKSIPVELLLNADMLMPQHREQEGVHHIAVASRYPERGEEGEGRRKERLRYPERGKEREGRRKEQLTGPKSYKPAVPPYISNEGV
jgi:hypothetical protein